MPSFSERAEAVVERLGALAAARASELEQAASTERRELDQSASAFKQEASQADARASTRRRQAENARDSRRSSIHAPLEETLRSMASEATLRLARRDQKTAALSSAAKAKREEDIWLADAMAEAASLRARQEFDAARQAFDARRRDLVERRAQAQSLLDSRRAGSVPEPDATESADADVDAGMARVERSLTDLERRVNPPGLTWEAILVAGVLTGVGGLALAYFALETRELSRLVWGSLAAAAAPVIVMAALRALARRRIAPAALAISRALADAAHAIDATQAQRMARRDDLVTQARARRDAEASAAQSVYAKVKSRIDAWNLRRGPERRRRFDRIIARTRAEGEARLAEVEAEFERAASAIEAERAGARESSARDHDARLARTARKASDAREHAAHAWETGLRDCLAEFDALEAAARALSPPWESAPSREPDSVPGIIPFGGLGIDARVMPGGAGLDAASCAGREPRFELPVAMDLARHGSLLIHGVGAARARAIALMNVVMLRAAWAFPPGKARFVIADPVGLGQSFAGFMHLADHNPQLVTDRIWTEPRHIEQRLNDLTEHMENVIQKYLRNEYATIQAYNADAGEVAEPYRFLVIADYPANITENAAKRLSSIATSGARCGVFVILAGDLECKGSRAAAAALADLAPTALRVGAARLEGLLARWPLRLDEPPPEAVMTEIVNRIGASARDAGRVRVPFEAVAPGAEAMWSSSSASSLSVPLGRAGARKLQNLALGHGTSQHALVAGRTGSGKSTLFHVLVTNLALWYSPREIDLYLVDFKKGVEFKAYASARLPHARVIAIESEREFGLSVLRRLDTELARRGALFRDAGVQDLAGYRSARGSMPRIMLIVDEFQEFFVDDDRLAQEAALLLDRLVRQGRAFGMHVVLGSQTLGGAYGIARATLGQMAVRIALQCSEADSYLILSEDNAAARLLSRPGEAIYNDASGLIEGNSPFQVVWLPEEVRERALDTIARRARDEGIVVEPPIVFEGHRPAEMSTSPAMAGMLAAGPIAPGATPRLLLGEPASIKEPTAVALPRRSGANLIVVGQDEDASTALAASALFSHRAQDPASRLVVLDGTASDSPHAGLLAGLARRLGATVGTPREAGALLADLDAELTRREQGAAGPTTLLMVHGLARVRDLRRGDEFSLSGERRPAAEQLSRLLREGPAHGIHAMIWSDTASNLERFIDRGSVREIDARVLLQMSAADSTNLMDGPQASTLGRHRALVYSMERGEAEKFRPFAAPDAGWAASAAARLVTP